MCDAGFIRSILASDVADHVVHLLQGLVDEIRGSIGGQADSLPQAKPGPEQLADDPVVQLPIVLCLHHDGRPRQLGMSLPPGILAASANTTGLITALPGDRPRDGSDPGRSAQLRPRWAMLHALGGEGCEESWERRADDPGIRFVDASKITIGDMPYWSVGVAVAEFLREDPLESELRQEMAAALRAVDGVGTVWEDDREIWGATG